MACPRCSSAWNDHQIDNVAFVCPGAMLQQKRGKLRVAHAFDRGYGVCKDLFSHSITLALSVVDFSKYLGVKPGAAGVPFSDGK